MDRTIFLTSNQNPLIFSRIVQWDVLKKLLSYGFGYIFLWGCLVELIGACWFFVRFSLSP